MLYNAQLCCNVCAARVRLCSVDIEGAAECSDIWDVYLTPTSSDVTRPSAQAAIAAPSYALQVLGRCGEAPSTPKSLSVWLDHIDFKPGHTLRFKVQTGPGGLVDLGHLQGIRQVKARIEAGVDCVDRPVRGAGGLTAGGSGGRACDEGLVTTEHAGPTRSWSICRPSWWAGGLQEQVGMFNWLSACMAGVMHGC